VSDKLRPDLDKIKFEYHAAPLVASVVGRVVDHRLFCGPSDKFLSREFGPLEKAKFQVYLARPILPAFATDFDEVVDEPGKMQGQIASYSNRRNLIEVDGQTEPCALRKHFC